MNIREQYEAGRIKFLDYIEATAQLHGGAMPAEVTLSNRVDAQLYNLAGKGRGVKLVTTTSARGEESEELTAAALEELTSCEIIKVQSDSLLDTAWRADLLIVRGDQPAIPVQVKSSKLRYKEYSKQMRRRGNRVLVPACFSGLQYDIHVESPIAVVAPRTSLDFDYLRSATAQLMGTLLAA